MLETEFLGQVLELATLLGWHAAHFRPAQTARGWRTPVQGDLGKGFPDLVLVRGARLVFAELKGDKGKVTPEQADVLAVFSYAAETYVWRPRDFEAIASTLR